MGSDADVRGGTLGPPAVNRVQGNSYPRLIGSYSEQPNQDANCGTATRISVYYPPIGTAARIFGRAESVLAQLRLAAAGFLTVRADRV